MARLNAVDLIGATILSATIVERTLMLVVQLDNGRRLTGGVMSDPEGNGPGSLHLVADGEQEFHLIGG